MKRGWQLKSFEDCIAPVTYTRKIQRKDFLEQGKFPIVSQEAAFINGYWNDGTDVFRVSNPVVIFGDHTKVLKYVDFDFVLGADGVKILQPREFLLPKFFFWHLQAMEMPTLGYARHYRLLKDMSISIPSLAEQQRIVGVLDEAFADLTTAQAHAEKNLRNTRALFESHLQYVFTRRGKGWKEGRLGDHAEFKNGLNFSKRSSGQRLRIVGVGDFQDNALVPTEALQSVTIDGALSDDYLIRRDDILTVRSNGSKDLVGRCMLVPEIDGKVSFSGFIIRIRFDTTAVSPRFLLHYMKSSESRAQITRGGGGANISNINQAKLSELPLSLPSFKEQEEIANKLDALGTETKRLEILYKQKCGALVLLKKSLLHQAFVGEL